jgi:ATP-dependent protease ClpP protease subunit
VEVYSDFLADMAAAQNWYADFLSRRTGLTAGRILGFMRDGISLFAKDAIDCGLVHEIIPVPSMITLGD